MAERYPLIARRPAILWCHSFSVWEPLWWSTQINCVDQPSSIWSRSIKSNKWEKLLKKDLFEIYISPISSEIEDVSPKDELTSSEISITSALCDCSLTGDFIFQSVFKDDDFQVVPTEYVIKRLCYMLSFSK